MTVLFICGSNPVASNGTPWERLRISTTHNHSVWRFCGVAFMVTVRRNRRNQCTLTSIITPRVGVCFVQTPFLGILSRYMRSQCETSALFATVRRSPPCSTVFERPLERHVRTRLHVYATCFLKINSV